MNYVCLIFAVTATAFGQFFFKRFQLSQKRTDLFAALTLFVITPGLSYCALRTIAIDTVYVFTALTILLVMLLSHFYLGESISQRARLGAIFIIAGVVLYGLA